MKSIWQKEIVRTEFKPQEGNIQTDVLIIGAGLSGILCGYMLKEAGVDSTVIEARSICDGVTKNTTAKVTCHHGAIFHRMLNRYGQDTTGLYVKAHMEALDKYRQMAEKFDFDFEFRDSYVYSIDDREKIEKEVLALSRLKCPVSFTDKSELPFPIAGAVVMKNQAQMHPLKLAYSLARHLNIYENTEAIKINGNKVTTNRGEIRAEKIIVATHFPILNRHGLYFLKMYQHRSYVLGLKNALPVSGMYIDEAEGGLSFRSYGDVLLIGGGGHRTGKNSGGWGELYRLSNVKYPYAEVIYRYASQDCKSLDDIAYIGRYSKNTPNLYVATGYNKWGMTSAMVAADIICDMIQGTDNRYSEIFSPQRSIFHGQLLKNAGEAILGILRPTSPRCSHLGCALKYNRYEHSWDCTCHGSRFREDGRVIDNPAIRNINIK